MMKLRKASHALSSPSGVPGPPPESPQGKQSRTMVLASRALSSAVTPIGYIQQLPKSTVVVPQIFSPVKPKTVAEQYWAARALTAEALLSVKAQHHEEVRQLTVAEHEKRSLELAAVHKAHEARQAKLERLNIFLVATLMVLAVVTVYVVVSESRAAKRSRSLHFTIPILSPFASVVEHDASFMSTRTFTIAGLISACLAYACFRYWLTYRRTPT